MTGQLEGRWQFYHRIATAYSKRVPIEDREDTLHDIMIELDHAEQRDGKPLPELRAYRIASFTVVDYWRKRKAVRPTLTLETEVADPEGHKTQLSELVADDQPLDLDAMLDAKDSLGRCPPRLIEIANKKEAGHRLTENEQKYLQRWRLNHKK
jgi:DNA-directed RNA polymerase specialized sigma24 family protein